MAKKPEKTISKKEKFDPVFIPFDYESHKINKVSLMKAELSVLKCLRIIENLKRFQNQKAKLKREFQLALSANIRDLENTYNEMPDIFHPREMKKIEKTANVNFKETKIEKPEIIKEPGNNSLGKELLIVQEKIKKLSAYQ